MPLKRHFPDITFSGNKVTPDEIDQDQQYVILKPSASATYIGTPAVGTQTQSKALVVVQASPDYPRTLVAGVAAASGSVAGGTFIVNGYDQFGSAITENFVIAPAAGGGTTNGTMVFGSVTSGTFNFGTGNPGNGTPTLGVSIAGTPTFGLPARLGATTDIKRATWVDNGTNKYLNINSAGTSATGVVATNGVKIDVAGGIAAADDFVITYRSSFSATADGSFFRT